MFLFLNRNLLATDFKVAQWQYSVFITLKNSLFNNAHKFLGKQSPLKTKLMGHLAKNKICEHYKELERKVLLLLEFSLHGVIFCNAVRISFLNAVNYHHLFVCVLRHVPYITE